MSTHVRHSILYSGNHPSHMYLRSVAVWANARNIIIVLTVLVLGHWSLILQGES